MVLDRAGKGQLHWTERYSAAKAPNYSAWEGGLFGVDNCEVAALILDEWRFPRELSTALRGQYLSRPGDDGSQLACLLNVANGMAEKVTRALVGELCFWEINPDKLQKAGLNSGDLTDAAESADVAFDAAIAALAM